MIIHPIIDPDKDQTLNQNVSITPLQNFSCDLENIDFDKNMCLRRASDNELADILKRVPGYEGTFKRALYLVKYVIEKKRVGTVDWDENSTFVRNIVLALRLLKPGDVYVPCSFLTYEYGFLVSCPTPQPPISLRWYYLDKKDVKSLKMLWNKLQNTKSDNPHLEFTLGQFMKAFEEKDPEDRIVELRYSLD